MSFISRILKWAMLLSILWLCGWLPGALCEPLQGTIQEDSIEPSRDVLPKGIEPMPVPVVPAKPLKGVVDQSKLKGNVDDQGMGGKENPAADDMSPLTGKASQSGPLQGSVDDEGLKGIPRDPDADDRELMVQWDRWRNHFLWAIQSGMQEIINDPTEANMRWDARQNTMVARFPMGTTAWFYCQVTPDLRIINLRLLHSSGFPSYDRAVIKAINDLQGSGILRYPAGSKRKIVAQSAGIKTADSAEFKYFKFGDIEHQRMSE